LPSLLREQIARNSELIFCVVGAATRKETEHQTTDFTLIVDCQHKQTAWPSCNLISLLLLLPSSNFASVVNFDVTTYSFSPTLTAVRPLRAVWWPQSLSGLLCLFYLTAPSILSFHFSVRFLHFFLSSVLSYFLYFH
jgi:hypothetical protein